MIILESQKNNKFLSIDNIRELVSKKGTPEDVVEISETNDELLKALRTLDPREQNIISP